MSQYFGKYRAIVVDVQDPEKRGQIKVYCPKVYGESKSPWCQPCLPYALDSAGDFVLPKLNEFVWVEFEEGDVRHPIYTGGLWSRGSSPINNYGESSLVRQIEFAGCKIFMKDKELTITNGDATIVLKDSDVFINGKPIITT